jgi:hypothetical protein
MAASSLDVKAVFERVSLPSWSALLPWKMNIIAVSADASALFVGEAGDLAMYPLDAHSGQLLSMVSHVDVEAGQRKTLMASDRQGDAINQVRCGWRGHDPILCAVLMNGAVCFNQDTFGVIVR